MEKLENLELVQVEIKDNKATLTFLDEAKGEIREVFFNKNVYDKEKNEWKASEDKAAKCEEWAMEYFGVSFDNLPTKIGERMDVFAYDNFNSLWESQFAEKFDIDFVGQIFETEIKNIFDDGNAIHIEFLFDDGKTYESKMNYSEFLEARGVYFVNPIRKVKQFEKFEKKFIVPFEQRDSLIGQKIMVEIKLAFNKYTYCEIKPLQKAKKKK